VEWTADRIVISLDGQPLFTFDPRTARTPRGEPLRRPMRLRMNLALGGSWGGEIDDRKLPARFEIQSVRIWGWAPGQVAPLAAAGAAQAPEPMPAAAPVAQESPPTRSAPDTPAATVPAAAPGLPAAPVESGGRGAPRWGR